MSSKTQSEGLSDRHNNFRKEGKSLNDDSKSSESILSYAMVDIISHAKELFKNIGSIVHEKSISLYQCQEYFN